MEKNVVLCDTNILIEFYKGNQEIITNLKTIGEENIAISTVTAGELIFGALNKKEVLIIKRDIEHLIIQHITETISLKFVELMLKYSKSHGLAVPDALIASTAIINNVEIYTLNKKDFKYIDEVKLYQ